jgi:lipoyl-dependent peroxiredoxin
VGPSGEFVESQLTHIYTAKALVSGGRNGHGRTDDGRLDVKLSRPANNEPGTNPEQLFAVGYAACFESSIDTAARRTGTKLNETAVTATVALHSVDDGTYRIEVRLDVDNLLPEDRAAEVELLRLAHAICPYSNALRGDVSVGIYSRGEAIAGQS